MKKLIKKLKCFFTGTIEKTFSEDSILNTVWMPKSLLHLHPVFDNPSRSINYNPTTRMYYINIRQVSSKHLNDYMTRIARVLKTGTANLPFYKRFALWSESIQ